MIMLLDQIEDIKQMPSIVDGFMKTMHHVHAAEKLVHTLGLLEGTSLGHVRALHDLHRGLADRTEEMHKGIIAELRNHMYLKDGNGLKAIGKIEPLPLDNLEGEDGANLEEVMEGDPSSQPQRYLLLLVKALTILDKVPRDPLRVPIAIETLRGGLKTEVSLIIDKAVAYAEDYLLPAFTIGDGVSMVGDFHIRPIVFPPTHMGER